MTEIEYLNLLQFILEYNLSYYTLQGDIFMCQLTAIQYKNFSEILKKVLDK